MPGVLLAQEAGNGGGDTAITLTAADLAAMPRASLKATIHGAATTHQGVWRHEVLRRAGVPRGPALRGKALAGYVLAEALDGYPVVFSLGEVDPVVLNSQILLAGTANDTPLAGSQGRFRLVVPKNRPAARSVRMLTKLVVVQLRK